MPMAIRAASGKLLATCTTRPSRMNSTEAAYAAALERMRCAGEIVWFEYESIKLRIGENTFYTPDFAVQLSSGELQMHEVKGYWRDDARVKIKVAAALYPFRFIAVRMRPKSRGGGWDQEIF